MRKSFGVITAVLTVITPLAGCSQPPQSVAVPTPTPQVTPKQASQKEALKAALAEELRAVKAKAGLANEAARKKYIQTETAILEEQAAGWSTDPDATRKAKLKHLDNEIAFAEAQLQNKKQAVFEANQIVNKPEYKRLYEELGVNVEPPIEEPLTPNSYKN